MRFAFLVARRSKLDPEQFRRTGCHDWIALDNTADDFDMITDRSCDGNALSDVRAILGSDIHPRIAVNVVEHRYLRHDERVSRSLGRYRNNQPFTGLEFTAGVVEFIIKIDRCCR